MFGYSQAFGGCEVSKTLKKHLKEEESMLLVARMLHLLLRQYGWIVPPDFLDTALEFLRHTERSMPDEGQQLENSAILDVSILRTDLMHILRFSVPIHGTVARWLNSVGELLEEFGRFNEAAVLYAEIARDYQVGNVDQCLTYANAALAFISDRNLDDCLEYNILALSVLRQHQLLDWDTHIYGEHTYSVIGNMIVFHH